MENSRLPNLIIAGTVKAATTSAFTYLSDHPQVCGSSIKETFFFLKDYTGNRTADIHAYSKYFEHCKPDARVVFEASPGYLEASLETARGIKNLLPNVKLIFILRDPVDRFYSLYLMCRRQSIDGFNIGFDEYVERCMRYSSGEIPSKLGLGTDFLRCLENGKYAKSLKDFYEAFPDEQIKVMFYEYLKADTCHFMTEMCEFLNIDAKFYKSYSFKKQNVTRTARMEGLRKFATFINKRLEPILLQHTALRSNIVQAYRRINEPEWYPPISGSLRNKLKDYYKESNRELALLLQRENLPSWLED